MLFPDDSSVPSQNAALKRPPFYKNVCSIFSEVWIDLIFTKVLCEPRAPAGEGCFALGWLCFGTQERPGEARMAIIATITSSSIKANAWLSRADFRITSPALVFLGLELICF
jgi:hypothetical protein